MPIKATKTANSDPCTTLSPFCGAPLLLPPVVPPCPCEKPPIEPVDVEPVALDVPEPEPEPEPEPPPVPDPEPEPEPELDPEPESDPELVPDPEEPVSPLCPLVPGPAPVKPGTVATSVGVAKAREAVGMLDAGTDDDDDDDDAFDDAFDGAACG